jgi:hypothetical protein
MERRRLRRLKNVRVVNIDNNFGEVEMCLDKKLCYNIKIKSRMCEMYIIKKGDFLKISINFKDIIEEFLKTSLCQYLRLMKDIENIINQYDICDDNDKIEDRIIEGRIFLK